MIAKHIHIYIAVLFCLILCYSCNFGEKKPIYLESLEMFNKIDSTKNAKGWKKYKSEYFIVKNYREDKKIDPIIDSLICATVDRSYKTYSQYDILLYKESNMTNKENLAENDRVLVRYSQSNDWIYRFRWFKGGKTQRFIKVKVFDGQYVSEPQQYLSCDE